MILISFQRKLVDSQLEPFLLTVELLCLQSVQVLIRRTYFPSVCKNASIVSKEAPAVSKKAQKRLPHTAVSKELPTVSKRDASSF